MEAKALSCPQCGSTAILRDTSISARCAHCGAVFSIEKKQEDNEKELFVNPKTKSKIANTAPRDGVIPEKYKNVWDEVEFLRHALYSLAIDKTTPETVMDSEFSSIRVDVHHYACLLFSHSLNYSCSIGYDRTEHYTVFDDVTDNIDGHLITRQVAVDKTRMVTDWHPHSGVYSDNNRSFVRIDGNGTDTQRFSKFFSNAKPSDLDTLNCCFGSEPLFSISDADISICIVDAQNMAQSSCRGSLPGNHVKDFRASCDTNLIASDYYIIPEYVLDFKYEKAKYIMKSFAAEKNIYRELPDNKSTVKKEVDLQTKPYLMSAIITASVFLIYVIVFIIIYGVLLPGTITAFWIISLSLLAAAVVLFVVYNKKRSNLTANAIVRGLKIKLDTLEKKLSELKLKPLSNEERERFAAQGQKWQRIK